MVGIGIQPVCYRKMPLVMVHDSYYPRDGIASIFVCTYSDTVVVVDIYNILYI